MGDFCWAELVKQGWCSPKLLLVVQRNSSVGSSRSAPATASPPASPWGLPELPGVAVGNTALLGVARSCWGIVLGWVRAQHPHSQTHTTPGGNSCLGFPIARRVGVLGYMPGTSGTSPAVLRADSDLFTYSRTFCSTCLTRHLSVCLEPGTFPLSQAWRARRYVCTGTRARETDCSSVHPCSSTSEEFGPFSCRAIAKFTPKRSHFFLCPPSFRLPSHRLGDGQ